MTYCIQNQWQHKSFGTEIPGSTKLWQKGYLVEHFESDQSSVCIIRVLTEF